MSPTTSRSPLSPLLAILFVASSSRGSNLVWSWPPRPHPPLRLCRPRPDESDNEPDVSWRASQDFDQTVIGLPEEAKRRIDSYLNDPSRKARNEDYVWRRPGAGDPRHSHHRQTASRPASGRNSPSRDEHGTDAPEFRDDDAYGEVLGYPPSFLAEVLSPKRALCHQKFELFVDELAFIGHPVCASPDGSWSWEEAYGNPEPGLPTSVEPPDDRGRPKDRPAETPTDISLSPELPRIDPSSLRSPSPRQKRHTNALDSFHLVLVLDRPDPSSVASSDLYKFVDVYYRQIAFKLTAAMHHEQGRDDYVTRQAALLATLKDECILRRSTLDAYIKLALDRSPLAFTIKTVFTSINSDKICHVMINEIPVQVQLPPNHVATLSGDNEDLDELQLLAEFQLEDMEYGGEDDEKARWEDEVQYGWKLPPLLPWKGILLLEGDGTDVVDSIWAGHQHTPDTNEQAPKEKEMLRRFVEIAAPTLSLSDIAALLDLDLQSEVYTMTRLLVYNRKAKIVDVIPSSLKNIYVPPSRFLAPIAESAKEFAQLFCPPVSPLPVLLSMLSETHRAFSSIVPTPDHRPMYTEVLIWLLQRDLLIMLHVRIRIVATAEIKEKVKAEAEARREQRRKENQGSADEVSLNDDADSGSDEDEEDSRRRQASDSPGIDITFEASSPEVARSSPHKSRHQNHYRFSGRELPEDFDDDEDSDDDSEDFYDSDWEDVKKSEETIICHPATATRTERRWLEAMMEGKDPMARKLFERLYVYFDGKKTTDEMLFRTELSRRQLREVLHHFEEYLITILHP